MPTADDLRTAMNDLAGATPAPASAPLLREAKRRRTRRRLLAGAGTAAAVLGVALAAATLVPRAGGEPAVMPPSVPGAVRVTPAPSGPALPRETRFVTGPERRTDPGVFTTTITDQQLPPGATAKAEVTVVRIAGGPAGGPDGGPDGGSPGDPVREITVAGTTVRLDEDPADPGGFHRRLEWDAGGDRYVLMADAYATTDDVVYGPDEDDLRWLVERIVRTATKD